MATVRISDVGTTQTHLVRRTVQVAFSNLCGIEVLFQQIETRIRACIGLPTQCFFINTPFIVYRKQFHVHHMR